ncbi:hypothetical protein BC939DRAFT_465743 [Gamsiella multidivaricata]|uniref:uncharacterized protein n=1 Tax=Gamsiella multidivaricata TaxID=101098 RepID=UPI00221E4D8A|nr:uncharacterized protein BC939DRAFT_465743 [Gamsiella multidivaricata]KAI7817473.1 hypothetical protein BC939DRAFT_465743 [Gamsiella multidivaricata]
MADQNPWQSNSYATNPRPPSTEPSAPASSYLPQDLFLAHPPSQPQQQTHIITLHPTTPSDDDAPPSYEAIAKDIPQLHDNYDHLRGPPGQRDRDIKERIPPESLSSTYYQSSNNAAGSSSSAGPSAPPHSSANDACYGGTSASHGIVHSPTIASAPELGLRGHIALSPDNDGEYAQDVDRLLDTDCQDDDSSINEDDPSNKSCWTIAGDSKAWTSLGYQIVLLLPWTLFCYCWTLCVVIFSLVAMIIPPLGYVCTIFSVTSWRALARVDLALSEALVSHEMRQRYPYIPAKVYIAAEPGPAWKAPRLFGYELPLPEFVRRKLQNRHVSRSRRPKNLWHRSAKHMRATWDRHSVASMFYFLVWKMMYAIPIFIVIIVLFSMSIPLMVCFLPSLLVVSRTFANWQYRWAVCWLSEKPAPIVV